jgi:hypothetical protein
VSRPANDVVVVTLDGGKYVAQNAPGEDVNGTEFRARRIAERPDHVWVCRDSEDPGCRVVIPAHAVARIWVRQLVGPQVDASTRNQEPMS